MPKALLCLQHCGVPLPADVPPNARCSVGCRHAVGAGFEWHDSAAANGQRGRFAAGCDFEIARCQCRLRAGSQLLGVPKRL